MLARATASELMLCMRLPAALYLEALRLVIAVQHFSTTGVLAHDTDCIGPWAQRRCPALGDVISRHRVTGAMMRALSVAEAAWAMRIDPPYQLHDLRAAFLDEHGSACCDGGLSAFTRFRARESEHHWCIGNEGRERALNLI